MFKNNVGTLDKKVRIAIGVVLLILVAVLPKTMLVYILGLAGIVLFLTAVINFCPLYRLLGIQTNLPKESEDE